MTRSQFLVLVLLSFVAIVPSRTNAQSQSENVRSRASDTTVVQTMTGAVRKDQLPTATARVEVSSQISELSVHNFSQLLSGRFAGVQVTSNGATGTGSRIRIRGQSSLFLSNDPLVIIDGVRLNALATSASTSVPSRLDDLNPDEIDYLEILSGPSATALYGTRATNGVINITTKRGKAGKTHFTVYSENGLVTDPNNYPDLYSLWGKRLGQTVSGLCTLALVSAKTCSVDSLSHGNVMNIDSLKPTSFGYRSQYGAQVSGGNSTVQYFLAGEREDETGVYKMPERDVTRLLAQRRVNSLPDNQTRPSGLSRNSFRANISAQLAPWLSLRLSNAYVNGDVRLVPNEGRSDGISFNATGGLWRQDLKDANGVPLIGYATATAGDVMSQSVTQNIDRYINSASVKLNPAQWFTARASVGYDHQTQRDRTLVLAGQGPPSSQQQSGYESNTHTNSSELTVDIGATATNRVASWLQTTTSIGIQHTTSHDSTNVSTTGTSSTGDFSSSNTGYYAEELVGFNNELFVTAAVRHDAPKLIAVPIGGIDSPSIGASWLVSNHKLFANVSWLNEFRVRGAYGRSNRLPENGEMFALAAGFLNRLPAATGPILQPEIVAETEGGFDASLFGGASNISFTYYHQKTTDAFVPVNDASSFLNAKATLQNAASIQNSGIELTFNQRVVRSKSFSANITLTGSTNKNRMTMLANGIPPIFTGNRSTERNVPGYPLFGLWSRTYTYNDANSDGILTANELTFSDTAKFIAPSFPTRELAITPSIELLNHKLKFSAQIDSKWGFRKFDNTLRHQCEMARSCRGLNDKSASLETQAAAVALTQGVYAGMFEDGSFTRVREASVSYALPTRWANAIRASSWRVVLTGRNLGLITQYKGVDPESSVGTTDAGQDEYFSTPPMRYYTLRFDIKF